MYCFKNFPSMAVTLYCAVPSYVYGETLGPTSRRNAHGQKKNTAPDYVNFLFWLPVAVEFMSSQLLAAPRLDLPPFRSPILPVAGLRSHITFI